MNRQFEIKIDDAIRQHWLLFTGNADSGFNIIEILKLALPEYCTVDKPIMCSSFLDEDAPQGVELTDEWEAGFEITWNWDRSGQELSYDQQKEVMGYGTHALETLLELHGRYGRKSYPNEVLEDIGPSLWFEACGQGNKAGVRYCFDDSTR